MLSKHKIPQAMSLSPITLMRDQCQLSGTNSIDLALTSPPYANAVDYPRTHQLEIYWLGFANGSLQPLKKQHVGTEAVTAKDYAELHKTGCEEADLTIGKIYEVDPRRAFIATKYLWDMFANLKEVYRVLKPGDSLCPCCREQPYQKD